MSAADQCLRAPETPENHKICSFSSWHESAVNNRQLSSPTEEVFGDLLRLSTPAQLRFTVGSWPLRLSEGQRLWQRYFFLLKLTMVDAICGFCRCFQTLRHMEAQPCVQSEDLISLVHLFILPTAPGTTLDNCRMYESVAWKIKKHSAFDATNIFTTTWSPILQ
jgi:hypothetical protein